MKYPFLPKYHYFYLDPQSWILTGDLRYNSYFLKQFELAIKKRDRFVLPEYILAEQNDLHQSLGGFNIRFKEKTTNGSIWIDSSWANANYDWNSSLDGREKRVLSVFVYEKTHDNSSSYIEFKLTKIKKYYNSIHLW